MRNYNMFKRLNVVHKVGGYEPIDSTTKIGRVTGPYMQSLNNTFAKVYEATKASDLLNVCK